MVGTAHILLEKGAKSSLSPPRASYRRRPQAESSTGYSSQPGDSEDKGLLPCSTTSLLLPAAAQH